MREELTEKIKHTRIICDFCGKGYTHPAFGIKQCKICKKDVCSSCAVMTESDYLREGIFNSDYPDYYCHSCWDKGADEREAIFKIRDEFEEQESQLLDAWKKKTR